LILALATVEVLAVATPAQAGQAAPAEDDLQRANSLFAQGKAEFTLGHYAEALPLFEQAYKTKPLPQLLFNIAQCHRLLGNLEQARRLYQNFLVALPNNASAPIAEEKLHEVEQALKAQAEARTSQPTSLAEQEKPASPSSKGNETAKSPTLEPHAPAPVAVGTSPAVASAAPPPSAPAVATTAPIAAPGPPQSATHPARIAGWTLVGVSVAAAGAGTVFGLSAKSSGSDWVSATTPAAWQSAQDDAHSKATVATVSWIAAGVLAAAGVATLLFLDR
jgi:tetratricopeptide (TPR) repeat protein